MDPIIKDHRDLFLLCSRISTLAYYWDDERTIAELRELLHWDTFEKIQYKKTGTQGVVLVSHRNKAVYIGFRGTEPPKTWAGIKDWLRDFRIIKTSYYGIKVHSGVVGAARSVFPQVTSFLREHPTYCIYLTGHSLGAMIASATCMALEKIFGSGIPITLVTYGEGKIASSKHITKNIRSVYFRIQNGSDAVPRRPNIPVYYGTHKGDNCYHVYLPNDKSLGLALLNPGNKIRAADRFMTFLSRLRDHSIADYAKELLKI